VYQPRRLNRHATRTRSTATRGRAMARTPSVAARRDQERFVDRLSFVVSGVSGARVVSATHFQFHEEPVLSQLAYQVVSLSGAVLVLIGYAALQRGLLQREDRWFNLLNFVGSALLAWIAILDRRWGFILLEVVWAVLSIPPLVRRPGRPSA